jgi:two-component system, HptB-dependent secretion and biofilm response regulator
MNWRLEQKMTSLHQNSATLLVMDDEQGELCAKLTHSSERIIKVQDSKEALGTLDTNNIDLVLIDTISGGMDRYTTASSIKNNPKTQHIPIIMVISSQDETATDKALNAGSDDFIHTPFDTIDLNNRINWLIQHSSKRRSETIKLKGQAELQSDFKKIKSALLQTSFYDLSILGNPLEETLKLALSIILSAPLLPDNPVGVIFLTDRNEETLHMTCQLGLDDQLAVKCTEIKKGICLCGEILNKRKILHYSHVDEQHTITYPGMPDHGHYVVPIMREKGRILGVLNIYVDAGHSNSSELEQFLTDIALILAMIISRKYYEARLITSESRFSSISNTSNDGIISIDHNSQVIFANNAANKIFCYQDGELIGEPVEIIIPEKYRKKHGMGVQRAIKTKKPLLTGKTIELTGLRKDRTEFPIEISVSMWESEGNMAFAAFIRDITERKELDKALWRAKIEVEKSHDELAQVNELLLEERSIIENIVLKIHHSPLFDPTNLRILEKPLEKNSGDLICATKLNDGARRVLLGDFAGHGLTAAIAGPLISEIFYAIGIDSPIEEIFRTLNVRLLQALNEDMFMACSCLELNAEKNQVTLFNAGMVDIFILRNGKIIHTEPSGFVPRGLIDVPDKEKIVFPVERGDRIVMCTDGFEESIDPNGKMLGEQRFIKLLEQNISQDKPLEELLEKINLFRQGGKQEDDMTLVELTC